MTAGPWGPEVNDNVVVKVWGFAGGILKTEAFGEGVTGAGGGIPRKVGWVVVGALAGRWMSGSGRKEADPGLRA